MNSSPNTANTATTTTDPNARKVAPPPFNKPSADTILRTSDGIDFHVRKAILAEAAQVFEDMFSLPAPISVPHENDGSETANTLPVVSIAEDSITLENFLRFAYPVEDPQMDSAVTIFRVFEATRKYMAGDIEGRVVKQLEAFAVLRPLPVYGLAAERGWRKEMELAAYCSLKYPLPDDFFVEEMENMTAGTYIRLQRRLLQGPSEGVYSHTSKPELAIYFSAKPSTWVPVYSPQRIRGDTIFKGLCLAVCD